MIPDAEGAVTELLERWSGGDARAADEVLPLVYDELRRIARSVARGERPNHTLQATAIVHEAYLRMKRYRGLSWDSRSEFLGFAAHVMRRLLVDYSRRRNREKREGRRQRVALSAAVALVVEGTTDLVALDDALKDLAILDRRKAQIVELRFFGGFSVDEISRQLGISHSTVGREWRRAKAWLYEELDARQRRAS